MSFTRIALLAAAIGWALPAHAQDVTVQFSNGLVSVTAENAPVRQILAEWARLGGTTFVNGDRVPGGPVTLQLDNVTEREALDVLLRSASGYMVAARESGAGASKVDRVLIVPTSSAPRPSGNAFLQQPIVAPVPEVTFDPNDPEENPPDDIPPQENERPNPRRVPFVLPSPNGRPQPPQPFQPEPQDDPEPDAERPAATNPFGVQPGSARPGVITPVPQQQQQPRQPQPDPEP